MSDVTVAVASALVQSVFRDVIDNFSAEFPGNSGSGNVRLSYDVKFHFRDDATGTPTIELRDDGTIYLHNLKILWDKLELTIDIDIPTRTIGGFCILPNPLGGCLVSAPSITLFGANPDISIPIALDGFVNSEASIDAGVTTMLWVNPARLPSDSDWDAHAANPGRASQWQVRLNTPVVNIAPIDLLDTVNDFFHNALNAALANLLSPLPGWARDFIMAVLGGLEWLITSVIGIVGSFSTWLEGQFGVTGGLLGLIETAVAQWAESQFAVPLFEEPLPLMDPDITANLGPVMLPIFSLQATVSSAEIVLEGSLG